MPKKLEENFKITEANVNEEKGIIKGVAVSAGQTTRNKTKYSLEATFLKKLPLLLNHDENKILGNVEYEISKSSNEVKFTAYFNLNTKLGIEYWEHVKASDLTGLSIGALAIEWTYDEKEDILLIDKYELVELSVVTIPSNNNARIHTIEKISDKNDILKNEGPKKVLRKEKMKLSERMELYNKESNRLKKLKIEQQELLYKVDEADGTDEINEIKEELKNKKRVIEQLEKELNDENDLIVEESNNQYNMKKELKKAYEKDQGDAMNKPKEGDDVKSKIFAETDQAISLFLEAARNAKESKVKLNTEYEKILKREGITGDISNLYPKAYADKIKSILEENGKLLNFFNRVTGNKEFIGTINTTTQLGHGWQGNSAEKTQVDMTFEEYTIASQYITAYLPISREQLDQPDEILYEHIIYKLPKIVNLTLEYSSLVDDGRLATDKDKIKEIKPIVRDVSDNYVKKVTAPMDADLIDTLASEVRADGEQKFMVMNEKTYKTLILLREATSGVRSYDRGTMTFNGKTYPTLNTYPIVIMEYLEDNLVIASCNKAYTLLTKQKDIETLNGYKISTNEMEVLSEIRAGGRITQYAGAAFRKEEA